MKNQFSIIMANIVVLASGKGTNFQALIDAIEKKEIKAKISLLITNNPNAFAIERAKKHRIKYIIISHKNRTREEHEKEILSAIEKVNANLIVLAGYMRVFTPYFFDNIKIPMINIHPALLPSFGGQDFYGERVHKAVLEYGCKVSGCTVHFVEKGVDKGPIILQKCVKVKEDDTPESLAKRILKEEHKMLPLAVKLFFENKLKLVGRRVRIL